MPVRRTTACVLALALGLVAPAAARSVPWATVNVCDTSGHPDTVGIRGSMPPLAGSELFMRFQLQLQRDDGSWRLLDSADSGLVDVGRARGRAPLQAGNSFRLSPPPSGSVYVARGLVTFEWHAKDGTVLRRARRVTTDGHHSTAGADPSDYSAAVCVITP